MSAFRRVGFVGLCLAVSSGLCVGPSVAAVATPSQVVTSASTAAISAGSNQDTCAVTTTGAVRCWGRNHYGKLGDGTTRLSSTPVGVVGLARGVGAVSAGHNHTCAVTTAGGVKCWGSNGYGELGDGTTTGSLTPVGVVGLASGVVAVSAGNNYTCALTVAGVVKCWGGNSLTPVRVSGLGRGVVAVSAGNSHTCALTVAGAVKCWGYNRDGQLGDGTTTDSPTPVGVVGLASGVVAVSAGYYNTCAVTAAGAVKCWGYNRYGELGDGTTTDSLTPVGVVGLADKVTQVSTGLLHTCAVTSSGAAKCWGWNSRGILGNGNQRTSTVPVDVVGLASGVVAVSAGDNHTCAVTSSGAAKCWGANSGGQLGNGTTTTALSPADVVGLGGG